MVDNFEDETEQSVTMDEYLDTLEEKELEADLVLGGDEGKECTYNTGYMKRQAIFSCLTCMPDGNAGVCTACSLSCHDGHEIVELWTKRNFCCDCGNSKFGTFYCKLLPAKDGENTLNSYNHNFKGLYCTCDRPYPNPEVEEQEEMIQCIICEDWFHEEHLGLESLSEIPKDEEGEPIYEDFICKACVEACSFLGLYSQTICEAIGQVGDAAANSGKDKHVIEEVSSSDGSGKLVNDTQSDGSAKNITVCYCNCNEKALNSGESSEENIDLRQCPMDVIEETPSSDGSGKVTTNTCSDGSAMKNEVCHSNCSEKAVNSGEISEKNTDFSQLTKDASPCRGTCLLEVNRVGTSVIESKPFFLRKGWRDNLCRCVNCLDLYKQKGVSYLLDKEDSIAEYEKIAKQKREAKLQGEEGGGALDFLDGLGHVEKIEVLSAIADFKDEFRSFLENFDSSNAITSSDISQIFENLAKKRRTKNQN